MKSDVLLLFQYLSVRAPVTLVSSSHDAQLFQQGGGIFTYKFTSVVYSFIGRQPIESSPFATEVYAQSTDKTMPIESIGNAGLLCSLIFRCCYGTKVKDLSSAWDITIRISQRKLANEQYRNVVRMRTPGFSQGRFVGRKRERDEDRYDRQRCEEDS